MFVYKAAIDHHNEPMKTRVGGYTHWIYYIEGNWTKYIQDFFLNDTLTNLLSAHYLFIYLFMIWFSPMYYILSNDKVMADKAALNYFVIYLLSVPFYLFFNVEVTSKAIFLVWMPYCIMIHLHYHFLQQMIQWITLYQVYT